MDSREYIFIYVLKTNSDIPADYPPEFRSFPFEAGVFLPQDGSNWFTRPPKYPARLLLLAERSLHIIPHPTSAESPVDIKLDDLLQLEAGTALLRGWLRFTTPDRIYEIVYNTRASRPLENFLIALKRRWLGDSHSFRTFTAVESYGDRLDIKFNNSVHFELDQEEAILVQFFQAPIRIDKRFLFFRRENWRAGNVLLLTSMNRLVWITDEYRRRRELYASVSFSAPLRLMRKCRVESNPGEQQRIAIQFASLIDWHISISGERDACSSFCQRINRILEDAGHEYSPVKNFAEEY